MEEGRAVPSRLMRSLLSLRVGVFFSCEGDGLAVDCVGAGGACVFVVGDLFFFGLFATMAHVGAETVGVGFEGGGVGWGGAEVDSGLDAGGGEGGASLTASLSPRISSLRALICA